MSDIVLDTSTATTDTIDYVATDTNGLISTSTCIVFVEPVEPSTPQSLLITDSPPLAPEDEPEDHEQPRTATPSPEHPRTTANANEHH